jgi:hypothetical protein
MMRRTHSFSRDETGGKPSGVQSPHAAVKRAMWFSGLPMREKPAL